MKSICKKLLVLCGLASCLSTQSAAADVTGIYEVSTSEAAKSVGSFSQGVRVGQFLYVSGQLGIDPATSKLVEGTVADQLKQVLDNVEAILNAAGLTFNNVVRTEIFLQDMRDFQIVNGIYAERIANNAVKPARQTIEVAALPRGGLVEISCIAYIPESGE